jgi:hypothetical protein
VTFPSRYSSCFEREPFGRPIGLFPVGAAGGVSVPLSSILMTGISGVGEREPSESLIIGGVEYMSLVGRIFLWKKQIGIEKNAEKGGEEGLYMPQSISSWK